ncbi:CLUMA_CG008001, isoform B [Clunio marinus]|nr:CLUMA_CG008001, isoform B [Clunio marinus]
MNRQRSMRSSRGSNSTNESDPREKMKDCCRKLVAFMFTQVGVGGLIVCYAICGAFIFIHIELKYDNEDIRKVGKVREEIAEGMWNATQEYIGMNVTAWIIDVHGLLMLYQTNFTDFVRNGYESRTPEEIWDFPTALMFCLSIFSMIGYGNTLPKTTYGKIMTMIYATFGIPLYILYFMNMGKVLAATFKWLYTWFHDCSRDQDKEATASEDGSTTHLSKSGAKKKIIVPSTACLWVITFYIGGGTIMFSEWEDWKYYDSVYFVVTSLCKIGFGDLVPGAGIKAIAMGNQTKLVINFVYILFGMGLVAMCYKLMREEVREKFKEMKEDAKLCLEDVSQKFRSLKEQKNTNNNKDESPGTAVIYFGGDVQDVPEMMEDNRDTKGYVKFNLDNTATILRESFPRAYIIVVRPARMEFTTFSCFDNFVRGNNVGIPDHTPMHYSLQHLEDKGCVVLNQFIYEFHYMKTLTPDDSSMMKLVSRIKHMYWLDGGHGGGKNTWITARSLLETLCRLGISVHVHVTPYQVQDDHRPWLRKEEKQFTDLLKKLGCLLSRTLHSGDSNMSNLFTHFEVLENFKKYQLQLQQQLQTQQTQSPSTNDMIQEKEQSTQQQNQIIQKTPSCGENKNAT